MDADGDVQFFGQREIGFQRWIGRAQAVVLRANLGKYGELFLQ